VTEDCDNTWFGVEWYKGGGKADLEERLSFKNNFIGPISA
jgi:hypothetical protein